MQATAWSQRALAFKAYFSEFGISSRFSIEEPGTPQNKAVLWLADQDPRQLSVPTQSVRRSSGYRAMQRYLLAVSYFQMGGTKWAHRLGFLSGNNTCNWNQQMTSNITLRGSSGKVRSRTIGVVCDASGQVVNLSLRKLRILQLLLVGSSVTDIFPPFVCLLFLLLLWLQRASMPKVVFRLKWNV